MGMLLETFQFATQNTNGIFPVAMLVSLYSVIFISLVVNRGATEVKTAFIAAGTITSFVAIFLRVMDLIPDSVLRNTIVVAILSIVITMLLKRD